MGRYHHVNTAVRMKQNNLRKVERDSLKERRRHLGVEINRLLKVIEQKLQEQRMLLATKKFERMVISKSDTTQVMSMLEEMEIISEDTYN